MTSLFNQEKEIYEEKKKFIQKYHIETRQKELVSRIHRRVEKSF